MATNMNEAMKDAWIIVRNMAEDPDTTDLDIFLRTWQLALQAQKGREQND
jgi:hypothetical protein